MEAHLVEVEPVRQVVEALPPMALVVLGALVVAGVVLWLLGRSLVRPACAVSGLVLGGVVGFVLGQRFAEEGAFTFPLVIGGGIAGALLAALMFRVWMGLSAAVLLALVAPAASIVWQGTPPPPIDLGGAVEEVRTGAAKDVEDAVPERLARHTGVSEPPSEEVAAGWWPDWAAALWASAKRVYATQAEALQGWWDELGEAAHWALALAALIGAGVGLVLGLGLPNVAASLQTALVGGLLMFLPGRELLARLTPGVSPYLPWTPRAALLTLGLITVLGVLVQWAIFREKADK